MVQMHPEFIVDTQQKTKAVILPFAEWEQVLEALEELDDIHTFDKVKSQPSEPIPLAQALKEIK
ncbi:MAG: hypothetical protein MJK04_19555 [Psychrosphaera sp.]|nr:hypothetical protein [Psychrosphaera sp.]